MSRLLACCLLCALAGCVQDQRRVLVERDDADVGGDSARVDAHDMLVVEPNDRGPTSDSDGGSEHDADEVDSLDGAQRDSATLDASLDRDAGHPRLRWANLGILPVASGGCGVTTDHAVTCWGEGREIVRPLEGRFSQVSGSPRFGCALTDTGSARCWSAVPAIPLVELPRASYRKVSVSSPHSEVNVGLTLMACGLRTDGTIACWGDFVNAGGQREAAVAPPGQFKELWVGLNFACALDLGSGVHCWGARTFHELGPVPPDRFNELGLGQNVACGVRSDGEIDCWMRYDGVAEVSPVPPGPFEEVAVFGVNMCGVRPGGMVECWGNQYHRFTPPEFEIPPVPLRGLEGGANFICGIRRDDDTAVCWGSNPGGIAVP